MEIKFMLDSDVFSIGKIISYTHVYTSPLVFGLLLFFYGEESTLLWVLFILSIIYFSLFFALNDYLKRQISRNNITDIYKIYPMVYNNKKIFLALQSGVYLSYIALIYSGYYYKYTLMIILSFIRVAGFIYHLITARFDKQIKKEIVKKNEKQSKRKK